MRLVPVLLGVLCLAAAAAVAAWTLRDDATGEDGDDAGPGAAASQGLGTRPRTGSSSHRPRVRAAAPVATPVAPPPPAVTPDALWDKAAAEVAAGRPLEALEMVLAARKGKDPKWKDAKRIAEILKWEDAALDRFDAAAPKEKGAALLVWLKRLDVAVLDAARRKRLDLLRRKLAELGKIDMATVLEAANADARRAIEHHLERFGGPGALPSGDGPARAPFPPGTLDGILDSVRARNEARRIARVSPVAGEPTPADPLPIDDAKARDQRRLEQLEKLRQRAASGLLEPIAAGLAWMAIHQADDGEMSDGSAAVRCGLLGHAPVCTSIGGAGAGQYRLAGTALAVLAFLDFRDQDLSGVFEPSLAAGVTWLRRQMRKDGSFGPQGYESAIALMALGQAARQTRSKTVLADAQRGLAFVAGKVLPDGGFRYSWTSTAGDLSATGWYVQAYEAVRDAGGKVPAGLQENLERFVRSTWIGGSKFKYVVERGEAPSLAAVGMLSMQILNARAVESERAGWIASLAAGAKAGRANLYAIYYEVREELALQGDLSDARRRVLAALPQVLQRRDMPFAGMFAPTAVADAPKQAPGQAAWSDLAMIDRGGRVVATAFSVLTMEHALYRR